MTRLVWDSIESRESYEYGVNNGVLYSKSQLSVPWNGLISVKEDVEERSLNTVYFDSKKILNKKGRGFFKATVTGVHLPDEFDSNHLILGEAVREILGEPQLRPGVYITGQERRAFSFSYQTNVGVGAYKIHLVSNAQVIQSSSGHSTIGENVETTSFTWNITTSPPKEMVDRPSTSHFVLDSRTNSTANMNELKDILYGTLYTYARFPTYAELIAIFNS